MASDPNLLQILILAIVQGAGELLPVSSSAHVIVAEKLMGLDPTAPQLTLLLVMLHTGTMFSVIAYFWKSWRATYFASIQAFRINALTVVVATMATAVVGLSLQQLIKHVIVADAAGFEIEQLFGNTRLIAVALAAAGVLIIVSSRARESDPDGLSLKKATWIGAVQGVCLPFRGFSRSGATISTALILGMSRRFAEEFSFALAVVLTPPVIIKEVYRLYTAQSAIVTPNAGRFLHLAGPSLIGMVFAFLAGLVALRWLSRWLEIGRWHYFGGYCLVASVAVLWLA
jgi:undecaprenyl-diphosphatase